MYLDGPLFYKASTIQCLGDMHKCGGRLKQKTHILIIYCTLSSMLTTYVVFSTVHHSIIIITLRNRHCYLYLQLGNWGSESSHRLIGRPKILIPNSAEFQWPYFEMSSLLKLDNLTLQEDIQASTQKSYSTASMDFPCSIFS